MYADMSDGELIVASRRKPELFEFIFERHHAAVFRFIAGRNGHADAADVAAETFVRAFDRRDRFRSDRESALPWLFGIAANVARERRRSWIRRQRSAGKAAVFVAGVDSRFEMDAAERVDALARRDDLRRALSSLADEEYQCLMLLAIGGLTYSDIADALGIPIGTVRSRIHRARRKMRELLEPERPIPGGSPVHERSL
jgi:RNA polymerase sigma-70 factor (ECF subfamily)